MKFSHVVVINSDVLVDYHEIHVALQWFFPRYGRYEVLEIGSDPPILVSDRSTKPWMPLGLVKYSRSQPVQVANAGVYSSSSRPTKHPT